MSKFIALLITVVALIGPVIIISMVRTLFFSSFIRYNIYDNFDTAYSQDYLDTKFQEVLNYLNPLSKTQLDAEFFSTEDILHMQDVRNVFKLVVGLVIVCSGIVLAYLSTHSSKVHLIELARSLTQLIRWELGMILGLALLFAVTWNHSFIIFHQLLFPGNMYWQLDPATSNLIKYLPAQIFQELGALYLALTLILLSVLYYCGSLRVKTSKVKVQ